MTSEALAHTNDTRTADLGADARRSDQLDAGAVGTISRVGVESEGLRAASEKREAQIRTERDSAGSPDAKEETKAASSRRTPKRNERDEDSYIIESGLKLLKVLECMEGSNCEPVTFNRMVDRTGFDRSFIRAAMITLKKARWAKEIITSREREFILGPKAESLAKNLSREMLKR